MMMVLGQPIIGTVKRLAISTGRLKRFLALHVRPINLVVYEGPLARKAGLQTLS
jgi:hypothetical protein